MADQQHFGFCCLAEGLAGMSSSPEAEPNNEATQEFPPGCHQALSERKARGQPRMSLKTKSQQLLLPPKGQATMKRRQKPGGSRGGRCQSNPLGTCTWVRPSGSRAWPGNHVLLSPSAAAKTCPGRERSRHKKKKQDLGWRPRSQDGFQRRLAQLFPQLF